MVMPLDALQDTSTEALLALYARGDPAAARVLTLRLTPLAYGLAYRMLGEVAEAEDVTQEALIRLWRIAADWRSGEAQVSTWLYRVVSNLATDRLRLRRRNGPTLDEIAEPESTAPSASDQLQDRARVDALQTALNRLPIRQKQAVILRHIEGLANPEIAQIMEISTEAVESLTARGKRALSDLLAGRRAELGYNDD
ncbi:MAG: RNA polymerase sigma factor [Paracoccaceae bacterium]